MSVDLQPHAEAILLRLRTVTMGTDERALSVGDAKAPMAADDQIVSPCAVLYGRDGGSLLSSIGALDTDGVVPFQVTSVGSSADEARTVADKCSKALTGSDLAVADRWCRCRRPSPSSHVDRDDDVQPSLFYVTTIYRLWSSSAIDSPES